ncbi:MAG TPA: molybdate ABC transporter substrate-binding protein [Longimicrobium sp.]|nr:molybdate ABC transporter substrate-binding protein [Longimicrobium sp.]
MKIIIPTLLLLVLAACGGDRSGGATAGKADSASVSGEILVFAAASLREAMQEAGAAFEQKSGARVVFNFAGSNDLAHQIGASRGVDLFLSASEGWMDTVQNAGRLVPSTRRDLLSNTLVVIAHARDTSAVAEPCALAALPFRTLSIGDPDAVPAGTYARTWMQSVQCGGRPLWDAVQDRVAPAPDVRAAVGLVLADPRVIGIAYKTDQIAFADRTRVLYEVRDGPPIRYVLAQVAEGDNPSSAQAFYGFLAGPDGTLLFRKHGFTPLPVPAP